MQLSSLPTRPLELAELRELNDSGRFRAVFPAAVFDLEDSEYKLVPAAVLVTDSAPHRGAELASGEGGTTDPRGRVVAAGYDFDSGWTRVDAEDASDDDAELKTQVETANQELQRWAQETEQRWAEPDGASALLERFED